MTWRVWRHLNQPWAINNWVHLDPSRDFPGGPYMLLGLSRTLTGPLTGNSPPAYGPWQLKEALRSLLWGEWGESLDQAEERLVKEYNPLMVQLRRTSHAAQQSLALAEGICVAQLRELRGVVLTEGAGVRRTNCRWEEKIVSFPSLATDSWEMNRQWALVSCGEFVLAWKSLGHRTRCPVDNWIHCVTCPSTGQSYVKTVERSN